ncbi:hypothetical protein [Methylobacter psychrophilus]|uniref:hypothetical protein n=1 Tax=Methylobacter psychrophilus TaxID=96941 RepID=UPI0021D4DB92|nr:hypothetical protein [Methylobacter psychrophilus]
MNNQEPPFYPVVILLTTLAVLATAAGGSIYSLAAAGGVSLYKYLFQVLLLIVLVGLKLAAPKLPWFQCALAVSVVFVIHVVAEHVQPLILIAEKVIEVVCVAGFGVFWVKKGYIPKESNRWH